MKYVCLFIFLLGAVGYDVDYRRIPNMWCLFGGTSGLIFSFLECGVHGCIMGLFGVVLPVVVLFLLFVWHVLGAGDIKLLSAIGSYLWLDICWITIYAFVLTAIYGMVVCIIRLLWRRQFLWTRICMSIPIAAGTILFVVGGQFF